MLHSGETPIIGILRENVEKLLRPESRLAPMKKKGRLQQGIDADVIVVDPATVQDGATEEESSQASVGNEARAYQ